LSGDGAIERQRLRQIFYISRDRDQRRMTRQRPGSPVPLPGMVIVAGLLVDRRASLPTTPCISHHNCHRPPPTPKPHHPQRQRQRPKSATLWPNSAPPVLCALFPPVPRSQRPIFLSNLHRVQFCKSQSPPPPSPAPAAPLSSSTHT
jgi:hypothetical protein